MMDSSGRVVTRQGSLIPIDRLPAGKLGGGGKWERRDIKRGGELGKGDFKEGENEEGGIPTEEKNRDGGISKEDENREGGITKEEEGDDKENGGRPFDMFGMSDYKPKEFI